MSLPNPDFPAQTFTQYPSCYFNGITFGPAPFRILTIEGLDMPNVVNGDSQAPRTNGQYIGLDLLDGRDITLTIDVGPPFGSYSTLAGAMSALRVALAPTGTYEQSLNVQISSASTQLVSLVRPRKRTTKIDIPYVLGNLAQNIPIQFHATDPTLYSAPTLFPYVDVPTPLGGFHFPMSFNLSFGGGSEASTITVDNLGDLPCYPQFTIFGPCTYPTITNTSIYGSPSITFNIILNSQDELLINSDPKYRSVQYNAAGSDGTASRLYTLSQGSSWFGLLPGTNVIEFSTLDASDVSGYLEMDWASAYSAAS